MSNREERWHAYVSDFHIFDRLLYTFTLSNLYQIRDDFARTFIRGSGYEIGAQNAPLHCDDRKARVSYIDYLDKIESARKYNLAPESCVDVDILCDANQLGCIKNESADFVIANHVLEHSPNPLGALLEWLRIVKKGGILFFSLPNYRANEFDFEKKPVGLEHLVSDFHNAGKKDISGIHIEEHVTIVDGIPRKDKERFLARKKEILQSNLHTHYHVFDERLIRDMLIFVHARQPLKILNMYGFSCGFEFIFVVQKIDNVGDKALSFRQYSSVNLRVMFGNLIKYTLHWSR